MAHHGIVAKCPYFAKENQTTIFCEGDLEFFENAEEYHAQVFPSGAEKTAFKRLHCGEYPQMRCRYADYLDKKYGGNEA